MQMTGQQSIPAPVQRVWEALCDPDILKQCIPGCQSLTKESDERMRATVDIRIGPIAARFNGTVTLFDIDAPKGCTLTIEGQGGTVGFVKSRSQVRLNNDGNGGTSLSYEVDAQVGGRMAQLGGPIIDSTAKQLTGRFFQKFGKVVGAPEAAAGQDAAEGTGAYDAGSTAAEAHGVRAMAAEAQGVRATAADAHAVRAMAAGTHGVEATAADTHGVGATAGAGAGGALGAHGAIGAHGTTSAAGHVAGIHGPTANGTPTHGAGAYAMSGAAAASYGPAQRGAPVAWILALVVAGLVGYLVGHSPRGGESDWMGLAIGLLLLVVGAAGFEFGRRAASPVIVVDPALLARLIAETKR